ncbi:hypothetical protein L596_026885 [Steinernema carpocapsae]|uniref:Uncharacterized protein n=1 Tax=Steinernema carpocapsae TaxID=34508 RepID=A0A4U5M2P0_STECR|nr:hypothetical protein L596_026885 [Steinernema carpocapsae]
MQSPARVTTNPLCVISSSYSIPSSNYVVPAYNTLLNGTRVYDRSTCTLATLTKGSLEFLFCSPTVEFLMLLYLIE